MSQAKGIPGLSIPIKSVDGYAPYYYTHQMLKKHSNRFKDYRRNAIGTKELMQIMGKKKHSKLYNDRQKWDQLNVPIPIEYFEAIGITQKMLDTTIEMDSDLYWAEAYKNITFTHAIHNPRCFVVYMPFEEELYETDAINRCREIILEADTEESPLLIEYPNLILDRSTLYQIVVGREKHHYYRNEPNYEIINGNYVFAHPNIIGLSLR